jgi:hypothetical protein
MPWDMSKAEPCRFCRGQDLVMQFTTAARFQVRCAHCGARGPEHDTKDAAMAAWGVREEAPQPPPPRPRRASARED